MCHKYLSQNRSALFNERILQKLLHLVPVQPLSNTFARTLAATRCAHSSDFSAEPEAPSQLSFCLLGGWLTPRLQQYQLPSPLPLAQLWGRLAQPPSHCSSAASGTAARHAGSKDRSAADPELRWGRLAAKQLRVPHETTVKALTVRHCLP